MAGERDITRGLASLLLAAGICVASSVRAADVSVRVDRDADGFEIGARADLDADRATAWSVLTDYARYGAFIPGVRASRIVDRQGTSVVVEQSDEVALGLLRVPLRVRYVIAEFPPVRLESRAIAPPLPDLQSSYVLSDAPGGVRLDYSGRIGAGWPIIGRLEQSVLERGIVRDFQALADEIERRSAKARAAG